MQLRASCNAFPGVTSSSDTLAMHFNVFRHLFYVFLNILRHVTYRPATSAHALEKLLRFVAFIFQFSDFTSNGADCFSRRRYLNFIWRANVPLVRVHSKGISVQTFTSTKKSLSCCRKLLDRCLKFNIMHITIPSPERNSSGKKVKWSR